MTLLFPSSLWNHAQLGGGSGVERLNNTLADSWVECCSDVTSYEAASFQDKYSFVFYS